MANESHMTAAQHHEKAAQAHLDAAEHHRRGFASKARQASVQAQWHSMQAREASNATYITVEYTVASIDPSHRQRRANCGAPPSA